MGERLPRTPPAGARAVREPALRAVSMSGVGGASSARRGPSPREKHTVAIELEVNGGRVQVDDDPSTPLLWVLRETLALPGTKYGCGAAQCGSCTVHVDGQARRSCVLPLEAVAGG